jgi:hypothetical protein
MQMLRLLIDWSELLNVAGPDAVVYAIMAIGGTLLFALRLVMMLVGFDSDASDLDSTGLDGGGFPVFSLLSITAFLMGAGFAGLAAQLEWGLGSGASAVVAGGFGIVVMMLAAGLLWFARGLDKSPTVDPRIAIGKSGSVYTNIPERGAGTGQIRINVGGRSDIATAISAGPAIPSFTDIRVTDCRDDGVYVVEALAT